MNDFDLTPDDPRLTAYALGELEGDERALVEAALRQDPELRDALQEIQATTTQIEAALAAESLGPLETPAWNDRSARHEPPLTPAAARTGELTGLEFGALPEDAPRRKSAGAKRAGPPKILQFPQGYFVIGGLAAACFVVLSVLHPPTPAPDEAALARNAKPVLPAAASTTTVASATVAPTSLASVETPAVAPVDAPIAAAAAVSAEPARVAETAVHLAALEVRPEADVAAAGSTIAGSLPLLEQAKAVEQAAINQGTAAENTVTFPPLALPRAPFVLTPPRSLAIGLPQAAAPALVPPSAESARTPAPSAAQASVRRQDDSDALRTAELRSTGSEAERARLMSNARRQIEAERSGVFTAAGPAPETTALSRDRAPRLLKWSRLTPPLGFSGEVRVEFQVDARGAVQNAAVVGAARSALAAPVLDMMRTWRFEPALKDGRAVGAAMEATVVFRTSGEAEVSLASKSGN